ncbi:enoyl-CoA hydratase-related protein, partial [Craterilacuibacter sp.]|uniref:enoyl-CoA hydratase-related protein n=1 Tax=Craterilacuibacter sp. TaxID=2870909 RepID=UPI003F322D49
MKYIVVEKLGQSAIVTIDNTPANVLSQIVLAELEATVTSLSEDENIRALVVTGAGERFFCAGADLNMFTSGDKAQASQVVDAFDRAFAAIRHFQGVTVAAINGYALGGGLELA